MGYTGDKKREYQREWIARRRAEFFAGKSCVKCGSTNGLELDHVNPSEKVSHRIWSWSEERRNLETAKCQVLCERCHLKKTIAESTKEFCKRGHSLHDADRKENGALTECRICRIARQKRARAK